MLINAGTPFAPQIDILNAICRDITIASGASLGFMPSSNMLELKGNFINNGTFNATAGKLKISGTGAQNIPAATYKDFELAGAGSKTAGGR